MKWLSDRIVQRLREEVDLPDLSSTKYRLIQKLDSGGMGAIYLAEDMDLDRRVALKVMHADPSAELAQRMLREARIVAQLEHPAIVPIHDVGRLPDGRVFYTMKYIQGRRLDRVERDKNPLPDLLRIFQKVCEAVAFAHAHGVIHRDLKPANIMVGAFGEVLVMDWGIAKVLHEPNQAQRILEESLATNTIEKQSLLSSLVDAQLDSVAETAHGTVMGTPSYMAPEQALGQTNQLDERTDMYALGAILYFLLCGRPPSESLELTEPGQTFAGQTRQALRQADTRIPRSIEAVCLKAMAKDPSHRYLNVDALGTDVGRFLDNLPVSAHRESLYEQAERWLARNHFLVFLIAAYLLMRIFLLLVSGR